MCMHTAELLASMRIKKWDIVVFGSSLSSCCLF